MSDPGKSRTALVMGGGGARGAYEAGVIGYLIERVYPELGAAFEFDIVSGTSVGAIHAAYVAASAGETAKARAARLHRVWSEMRLAEMLRTSWSDLARVPLRALGLTTQRREPSEAGGSRVLGGLADLSALEQIVARDIPWDRLPSNLAAGRPGALCVTCTEVRSGLVTVFMEGPLANPDPWSFDPMAQARMGPIAVQHVRASAAIPFLFPAVQVGPRYYVDGGVRTGTPLSPAVRLGADRILVVTLSRPPQSVGEDVAAYPDEVIAQPTFLLGKLLDAMMLDPLDYEIARLKAVNAWIAQGRAAFGDGFLDRINLAVQSERGLGYRAIEIFALRPSEDLGVIAARSLKRDGARSLGRAASLLARFATRGSPENDADFFSYLYFDRGFTRELLELGRRDAEAAHAQLVEVLGRPAARA